MNKTDSQQSKQSAAHAKDHAATSTHGAAVPSFSKASVKPDGEPNVHVCTDACTHAGAANGAGISVQKSGARATPGAPNSGNAAPGGGQ